MATVAVPPPSPKVWLALSKNTWGKVSSSRMVRVWVPLLPTVALLGVPMVSTTVSLGSWMTSLTMLTVIVAVVLPAAILRGLAGLRL